MKIYGQLASIMPFEVLDWEKLFWFLKFLVPKIKVEDPKNPELDDLLDSIDLSTYGLQRTKLNYHIGLDDSETVVDPQNPNPRGAHGGDDDKDPLDEIIQSFNERWFQGWSATPEEQRIKFINIANSIKVHPDFLVKFEMNGDPHTRELAFDKIIQEVMLKRRKEEQELYKLFAQDSAFKTAMSQSLQKMLDIPSEAI